MLATRMGHDYQTAKSRHVSHSRLEWAVEFEQKLTSRPARLGFVRQFRETDILKFP